MSLVETLAKVAVGVALAKGASALARGGSGGGAASASTGGGGLFGGTGGSGGLADMLGGALGGTGNSGASGGSLADMLGGMMGGGTGASSASAGGGLGDLLGGLAGGAAGGGAARSGGGTLTDMLGQMMGGGAGGMAGGLGGLLDSLGSGAAATTGAGGLGSLVNQSLKQGATRTQPTAAQETQAELLLKAMIQAAKCDGRIDDAEKAALTKHLGDVSADEARVVQAAFSAPVDIDGLVAETPKGMESQVYMMSLLGLDLDSQPEAEYLHKLGTKLGIDAKTANAIHAQMGEPPLYR